MSRPVVPPYQWLSRSRVCFDYGYRMAVMTELRPPNRFICGYCRAQAVTGEEIKHLDGCPQILDRIASIRLDKPVAQFAAGLQQRQHTVARAERLKAVADPNENLAPGAEDVS